MLKISKNREEEKLSIINEQVNLGIIEVAPDLHSPGSINYLPLRPVVRDDKATTKVRMGI